MNELQFECFLAVAECRNFSRAAEKLYVTQPAISKQIRLLEDEWGITLFYRQYKNIELTPAGKVMLDQMKFLRGSLNAALEQARLLESQQEIPTLNIGLFERHNFRQFPRICSDFMSQHHNLKIVAEEQNFSSLNEGLHDMKYDLIFTLDYMVSRLPFVSYTPLASAQYIAFISSHHPLATNPELTFKDLQMERWYIPTQGRDLLSTDNLRNVCITNGFSPHSTTLVPNVKTALMGVSLNNGVVLLDDYVYLEDSDDYIKIPSECFNKVILAWRKQDKNPVIPELVDFILKNAQSLQKERGV